MVANITLPQPAEEADSMAEPITLLEVLDVSNVRAQPSADLSQSVMLWMPTPHTFSFGVFDTVHGR